MASKKIKKNLKIKREWEKLNPSPNISCRHFVHLTEIILWVKKDIKKIKNILTKAFFYGIIVLENKKGEIKMLNVLADFGLGDYMIIGFCAACTLILGIIGEILKK